MLVSSFLCLTAFIYRRLLHILNKIIVIVIVSYKRNS